MRISRRAPSQCDVPLQTSFPVFSVSTRPFTRGGKKWIQAGRVQLYTELHRTTDFCYYTTPLFHISFFLLSFFYKRKLTLRVDLGGKNSKRGCDWRKNICFMAFFALFLAFGLLFWSAVKRKGKDVGTVRLFRGSQREDKEWVERLEKIWNRCRNLAGPG